MKKLFRSSWFQVIFFGLLIGVVFILLDNRYNFFAKKDDKGIYKGVIEMDKDKMYFTKAEYSEFEYNFGKVKEGDTLSHVFKLKNVGEEPLIIYKHKGSCECIGARSSGNSIKPDSTGEITVYFDTKGRKGPQTRTVSVITNTDPAEAILTFKGEVE
jgi:hypothetical protein